MPSRVGATHATTHGWSEAEPVRRDDEARRPPDGRFFAPLGAGLALWTVVEYPTLVLRGGPRPEDASRASWYASYASADLAHAVAWHLADPDAPLRDRPFDALLRCYGKGFYPFCLAADRVVLFSFEPG